jgi:hypothetical protein
LIVTTAPKTAHSRGAHQQYRRQYHGDEATGPWAASENADMATTNQQKNDSTLNGDEPSNAAPILLLLPTLEWSVDSVGSL